MGRVGTLQEKIIPALLYVLHSFPVAGLVFSIEEFSSLQHDFCNKATQGHWALGQISKQASCKTRIVTIMEPGRNQ